MAAVTPRNRILPGTSNVNTLSQSQMASVSAVSRLCTEMNPSGPTSKAKDRDLKASKRRSVSKSPKKDPDTKALKSRSVSKSPKRRKRKSSCSKKEAKERKAITERSEDISVSKRRIALTRSPRRESRPEQVLSSVDKGKISLVAKPTKKEDAPRKEICLPDAVKSPNVKNDLKNTNYLPSLAKGEKDISVSKRIALTRSPQRESRHEQVLPSVDKGKTSLVAKPTKMEDASRKEICLPDAVKSPNVKNDLKNTNYLPSLAKSEKFLISKPARKEDNPEKKFCMQNATKPLVVSKESPMHKPIPSNATKENVSQVSKLAIKEDIPEKKVCLMNCSMKPSNLREEKIKFINSNFTYNPQFVYSTPSLPDIPGRYGEASDKLLDVATDIINNTLQKYGTYEKYVEATGGRVLRLDQIHKQVQRYMEKERCEGEMALRVTKDTLSHAAMEVGNKHATLTINLSTAREKGLKGTLQHEIGTHYYRSVNNRQQPWKYNREKYGLQPANPTEEGFASINTILLDNEPYLCKIALLYYAIYKASCMSFSELFQDLRTYISNTDTLWFYCLRAKRGQTDTSQPGCYSKDQVYLDGALQILRHRQTIDFKLLMSMGKISYVDIERLKDVAVLKNARIPNFLKDKNQYMKSLDHIMEVNKLTDDLLKGLIE